MSQKISKYIKSFYICILYNISYNISHKSQNMCIYLYTIYNIKDDKLKRLYQCIKKYAKTLRTKFEHISIYIYLCISGCTVFFLV